MNSANPNHKDKIIAAVFEGIRKTINRFREQPFRYFTESDIHAALLNDIMDGSSDILIIRDHKHKIPVSLVHCEYPTNYRFSKNNLEFGYSSMDDSAIKEITKLDQKHFDRGNFDLAILNPDFIYYSAEFLDPKEMLDHVINKSVALPMMRKYKIDSKHTEELIFAIEVKFVHPSNSRNKSMLSEVVKDNEKLKFAYLHSDGKIIPINLIFCTSESKDRRDKKRSVIEYLKDYIGKGTSYFYDQKERIIPDNIANIFIESYLSGDIKKTPKPKLYYKGIGNWIGSMKNIIPFQ